MVYKKIKKFAKGLEETRKYRAGKRTEMKKAFDVAYYKEKKKAVEAEARKAARRAAVPRAERLAKVGQALAKGFEPLPARATLPQRDTRAEGNIPFLNPELFVTPAAKKIGKKPKRKASKPKKKIVYEY